MVMVSCSSESSYQGITPHKLSWCAVGLSLCLLTFHFFRRLFGPEEESLALPLALRASLISLAVLLIVALSSSTLICTASKILVCFRTLIARLNSG